MSRPTVWIGRFGFLWESPSSLALLPLRPFSHQKIPDQKGTVRPSDERRPPRKEIQTDILRVRHQQAWALGRKREDGLFWLAPPPPMTREIQQILPPTPTPPFRRDCRQHVILARRKKPINRKIFLSPSQRPSGREKIGGTEREEEKNFLHYLLESWFREGERERSVRSTPLSPFHSLFIKSIGSPFSPLLLLPSPPLHNTQRILLSPLLPPPPPA